MNPPFSFPRKENGPFTAQKKIFLVAYSHRIDGKRQLIPPGAHLYQIYRPFFYTYPPRLHTPIIPLLPHPGTRIDLPLRHRAPPLGAPASQTIRAAPSGAERDELSPRGTIDRRASRNISRCTAADIIGFPPRWCVSAPPVFFSTGRGDFSLPRQKKSGGAIAFRLRRGRPSQKAVEKRPKPWYSLDRTLCAAESGGKQGGNHHVSDHPLRKER